MKGKFFCDVCNHWFNSESDDEKAICTGCKEDVLDTGPGYESVGDEQTDDLFGLDHYGTLDDA